MFVLNDYLYFPVLFYNEGGVGFTTIYKIDENGETVDSVQIIDILEYPTNNRGFNRIHEFINNEGNHVIIGDTQP